MNERLDPGTQSDFNGRLTSPLAPWAASRLLHLGLLNSGSYVSERAKQLGKVRETRFVWARLATAQPSTHPKRPGPRLGPHATHFLKYQFL